MDLKVNLEISIIVNEAIKTILKQPIFFLFFFYEKIVSIQKASKRKIINFPLLEVFMCETLLPLLFLLLFVFLLNGFGLICVFIRSKSFREKKISWPKIVLIASFTYQLSKLLAIFADFKQVKNSFRRNSVSYGTPCHAIFGITMLLTGRHAMAGVIQ